MKRWLSLLLLALCWATRARAQAALPESVLRSMPPLSGQLDLRSTPFFPSVGRKTVTWTYLPPGYNEAKNANRRYPVVYLMHGEPGTWTDCFLSGQVQVVADKLISQGKIGPMILVCLDGSGPKGVRDFTNFCDRPDGYRTEQMIARDLVGDIDRTYRTVADADHRALWGYSAGGFASLNIGFHYPNVFHVLASHAGFYQAGADPKIMRAALGQPSALWDKNSPLLTLAIVPARAPLHIYLDDSPKSEGFADFDAMTKAIRTKGLDLDTDVYPKAHSWKMIQEHCARSLEFISRSFGAASARADESPSVAEKRF